MVARATRSSGWQTARPRARLPRRPRGRSPSPCRIGCRPRARSRGQRAAPGAGRGRSCRRSSATTSGAAATTVRCGSDASRKPGARRTPGPAGPARRLVAGRSRARLASSWSVRAAWARPTRSLNSSSVSRPSPTASRSSAMLRSARRPRRGSASAGTRGRRSPPAPYRRRLTAFGEIEAQRSRSPCGSASTPASARSSRKWSSSAGSKCVPRPSRSTAVACSTVIAER